MFYTAVYVFGGLIRSGETDRDLQKLVRGMHRDLESDGFDPAEDDARIIDMNNNIVYSFPDEAYAFLVDRNTEVKFVHWDRDEDIYTFLCEIGGAQYVVRIADKPGAGGWDYVSSNPLPVEDNIFAEEEINRDIALLAGFLMAQNRIEIGDSRMFINEDIPNITREFVEHYPKFKTEGEHTDYVELMEEFTVGHLLEHYGKRYL